MRQRILKENFTIGDEEWKLREIVNEKFIYQVSNPSKHYCYFVAFIKRFDEDRKRQIRPAVSRYKCYEDETDWFYKSDNLDDCVYWSMLKKEVKRERPKNYKKLEKPVLQYTKDGEFIAEYYSLAEAYRATGVSMSGISSCCNGRLKLAGGFLWRKKIVLEV